MASRHNNLTSREQRKYKIIGDYIDGIVTRKQASLKLGVTPKTVSSLKVTYEEKGILGFMHRSRGKKAVNRTDLDMERQIVDLYKNSYAGFNFTHFYENIIDDKLLVHITHGKYLSGRTVFNILRRHGVVSPMANRKNKKKAEHPLRPRRQLFGELIQMDASIHDWLSLEPKLPRGILRGHARGKKITLHLAIDDATSQLLGGFFCETETLRGYYQVAHQILMKYGIPGEFYTDRRSVFEYLSKQRKEDEFTQFERACNTLGIGIITTSIAEAKGRIERSFRTHQDRLVSELRQNGIVTIDEANEYLVGYTERHNKRFAKPPRRYSNGQNSAFKPLDCSLNLNKILSVVNKRKVLNGNVISYKNKQYYSVERNELDVRKWQRVLLEVNRSVDIVETLDGKLMVRSMDRYYGLKCFANGRFTAHKPPATHPWKQTYGQRLG